MSERSLSDLPEKERREAISEGLLTVRKATEAFPVLSKNDLWSLITSGRIPVTRKGKRMQGRGTVYVPRKLLVDLINEQIGAADGARA